MEELTKCRYVNCVDMREKEQILHELPACDIGLCVKWLINSGHVDLVGRDLDVLRSMKFFICNNHFTEDCYLSKGTLKDNAVPSPHWNAGSKALASSRVRRFQKVRLNGEEVSAGPVPDGRFIGTNGLPESEVDRWCRTCATRKLDLVSMTTKRKGTEMSLLSKLKLLIEIDDEDALPTKMCDQCVVKLEQSFKFFQQIYVADNTWRRVFSTTKLDDTTPCASRRETRTSTGTIAERAAVKKQQEDTELEEQALSHAPKTIRGGFVRRGRGRPRSRGSAARSRVRARPSPKPSLIRTWIPSPNGSESVDDHPLLDNESETVQYEVKGNDRDHGAGTVFSLLTDTCRSDEELDWADVLKLMNHQERRTFPQISQQEEPVVGSKSPKSSQTMHGSLTLPTPPIHCEFCNSEFKLRRQLRTHLLTDHSQLSRYMCADCVTCHETSVLLSHHRAVRHGDRKYFCDHCRREFPEKKELKKHMRDCQPLETRYSCDFCEEMFVSKQVLVEHVKNHSEILIEPFPSNLDKSEERTDHGIPCKGNLDTPTPPEKDYSLLTPPANSSNVNENSNTNTNTHSRTEESTMRTEASLGIDEREQNRDGNEPEFAECPDCDEKFANVEELTLHRMYRHSIKTKDSTCLLCENKSFSSAEEYEEHILEHRKRLKISP